MKLDSTNTNDIANKVLTELERDMLSLRTKEALKAKKASGITLGKPIGTVQSSMFDEHKDMITELLGYIEYITLRISMYAREIEVNKNR